MGALLGASDEGITIHDFYVRDTGELLAAYDAAQARVAELEAQLNKPYRHLCDRHPDVNYRYEWACPNCLAELRARMNKLAAVLAEAKDGSEHA